MLHTSEHAAGHYNAEFFAKFLYDVDADSSFLHCFTLPFNQPSRILKPALLILEQMVPELQNVPYSCLSRNKARLSKHESNDRNSIGERKRLTSGRKTYPFWLF